MLCTGAREAAFRNIKTIAECLADELINAAKVCKQFTVVKDEIPIDVHDNAALVSELRVGGFACGRHQKLFYPDGHYIQFLSHRETKSDKNHFGISSTIDCEISAN